MPEACALADRDSEKFYFDSLSYSFLGKRTQRFLENFQLSRVFPSFSEESMAVCLRKRLVCFSFPRRRMEGKGGEIRRVHIIYFLSRMGRIEHPHLIRVNHVNRSGVHLKGFLSFFDRIEIFENLQLFFV